MDERDQVHLERIVTSIKRLNGHLSGLSESPLTENTLAMDAVLMQLINIGESVNQLSDSFRENHPELPLLKITGMRNQIAHGYFEISPEVIWQTCQKDIPSLQEDIQKIIG